jgi:hypothetical protein
MDILRLLNEIKSSNRYQNQIVHIEEIPARKAIYAPLELKTQIEAALSGLRIKYLCAEKGYDLIEQILEGALKAIESYPCESGCPSCIQSAKCGNNNEPLDKHAAIMILHEIMGNVLYIPYEKKEKNHSEIKSSRPAPEEKILTKFLIM